MKARIPLFGIVLSLASVVTPSYAEKIKITEKTVGEFTMLRATNPPLACHRSIKIGTLSKTKLAPGTVWQSYDQAATTKKLAAISKKLKKKKKLRPATRKSLAKDKKTLMRLMAAAEQSGERCKEPHYPDDGEFIGNENSLEPYREHLSEREVQHILDRVAFGGNVQLKQIGKEQGLNALVNALVDGVLNDSERAAFEARTDRWADMASWYDSDDLQGKRVWTSQAVEIGEMYRIVYSPEPFREWMTVLLSGHFAVNLNRIGFSYNTYSHQGLPAYVKMIRDQAMGSFEELAKGMLTDRAMNEWLDNKNNRVNEPNQNFARELLELFLLGEIDPITHIRNYNEDSVDASTAFMSGFVEDHASDPVNGNQIMSIYFESQQHDTHAYTVFKNIPGAEFRGSFEPAAFISYILYQHPNSSRYIAERIAGQVLYPGMSEENVAALAAMLRENHYQMKPMLKRILKSSALFSAKSRGACINSPVDHFARLARILFPELDPARGSEAERRYFYSLWALMDATTDAGQRLFEPPSVFGWKGSCNINRAGETARGEGWASMQRVLGRMRGCGDIMNNLNWQELDFVQQLSLNSQMGAFEIVEHVRKKFGVRALSEQEKNIFAQFLVTELDEDGKRSTRNVDVSEEWYVRRKIPRLICMLLEIPASEVR